MIALPWGGFPDTPLIDPDPKWHSLRRQKSDIAKHAYDSYDLRVKIALAAFLGCD